MLAILIFLAMTSTGCERTRTERDQGSKLDMTLKTRKHRWPSEFQNDCSLDLEWRYVSSMNSAGETKVQGIYKLTAHGDSTYMCSWSQSSLHFSDKHGLFLAEVDISDEIQTLPGKRAEMERQIGG